MCAWCSGEDASSLAPGSSGWVAAAAPSVRRELPLARGLPRFHRLFDHRPVRGRGVDHVRRLRAGGDLPERGGFLLRRRRGAVLVAQRRGFPGSGGRGVVGGFVGHVRWCKSRSEKRGGARRRRPCGRFALVPRLGGGREGGLKLGGALARLASAARPVSRARGGDDRVLKRRDDQADNRARISSGMSKLE